ATLPGYPVVPHPMHHPGGKPDRQGHGPEVSPAVKTLRVEEPRSDVGHARVGSFEERVYTQSSPDHLEVKAVARGVDRPAGDAEDRILEVRPERAKGIEQAFLLGAIGSLETVVHPAPPHAPSCFAQAAVELKQTAGLGRSGPLSQGIKPTEWDRTLEPCRAVPLLLVASRPQAILR